ncbi:MAG: hypothetical protein U5J83_15040 [Bryobacterales bacterium]|nr:hypothetical protein [Bryobacterales bacterium]
MNYVRLLRSEGPLLWFGLATALSTSFGQTFFIALSVPVFLKEFALGEAQFGLLYSLATVVGALALPYTGSFIDRILPSPLHHSGCGKRCRWPPCWLRYPSMCWCWLWVFSA